MSPSIDAGFDQVHELAATKVVRVALENAVTFASTLLLTEATLTEEREKQPERTPIPEFAE